MKVREHGRVVNAVALVAAGVNADRSDNARALVAAGRTPSGR
ncbi:hypothetical protein [Actinoplanes sp. NPDC049802]